MLLILIISRTLTTEQCTIVTAFTAFIHRTGSFRAPESGKICLTIRDCRYAGRAKMVAGATDVRPSPLAGRWYPADPTMLAAMLDSFLSVVKPQPPVGKLVG